MTTADRNKRTKDAEFRTSRQAWLDRKVSPLVGELDERVANLTRVHSSHNELAQLLRYDAGQFYHAHMDWSQLADYNDQEGEWLQHHYGHQNRMATVFMYLNHVEGGGETVFPKQGQPICFPENLLGGLDMNSCKGAFTTSYESCNYGLKVKPSMGKVLLWYNVLHSGRGDQNALHGGCPVGDNLTKWSINKWVNMKPFDEAPAQFLSDHPALARFGWAGDSDSCQVTFTNNAASDADVLWISEDGHEHKITDLPSHASRSLQSHDGHMFLVRWGSDTSNVVMCQRPSSAFVAEPDHQLIVKGGLEL